MLIETDNYIDASQAGEILKVSRYRVSKLCLAGRFPGQVKVGHFWLIPREAVENFTRLAPGRKSQDKPSDND